MTSTDEIPDSTATCHNRQRTLSVRANHRGQAVAINIERSEYAYGAQALASEIQRLTQRATVIARGQRRVLLSQAGIGTDLLDKMGLPTREQVSDYLDQDDIADTGETRWAVKI